MSTVGEREIHTQRRVAAFLQDALGYVRLGDWRDRAGNANVEKALLSDWLRRRGYDACSTSTASPSASWS